MPGEFIDYSSKKKQKKGTATSTKSQAQSHSEDSADADDTGPPNAGRSNGHGHGGISSFKQDLRDRRKNKTTTPAKKEPPRARSKSRTRSLGGDGIEKRAVLPSVLVNSDPIVDYRKSASSSRPASTAEAISPSASPVPDDDDDEDDGDDSEDGDSDDAAQKQRKLAAAAGPTRRKSVTYSPEEPKYRSGRPLSPMSSDSNTSANREGGSTRKSSALRGATAGGLGLTLGRQKSTSTTSSSSKLPPPVTQQTGPRKLRRKSLSASAGVQLSQLNLGPSLDSPGNIPSQPEAGGQPLRRTLSRSSSRAGRGRSQSRDRGVLADSSSVATTTGPNKLRRRSLSRAGSVRSRPESVKSYALQGDDRDYRDDSPPPQPRQPSRRNSTSSKKSGYGASNGNATSVGRRASVIVAAAPIANRWSDSDDDSDLEQRADRNGRGMSQQRGSSRARSKSRGREEEQLQSRPAARGPDPNEIEGKDLSLTPQDRHYLNRILVNLEMSREGSLLSKIGTLSQYGPPFLPHANGPNSRPTHLSKSSGGLLGGWLGGGSNGGGRTEGFEGYRWSEDEAEESPVLKYLFWRFLYNAPVLREAKQTYWTDQIQPFFDSFAERDLSTTSERSEVTKRRLLVMGITRILGTYYSTCIPPLGKAAPARPTITMMRRIDHLVPGSMNSMWSTWFPGYPPSYNAWTAVVAEEQDRGEPAFLVISRVVVVEPNPAYLVLRRWTAFKKFAASLENIDPDHSLNLPLLPRVPFGQRAPARDRVQQYLRSIIIALSAPPEAVPDDAGYLVDARARLEAFLLGSAEKVRANELEEWIEAGEREEVEADRKREQWTAIGQKGRQLRSTWVMYRGALIEGDEIDKSIAAVKKTSTIKALPAQYQDAEKWASMWVAYALHYFFVSSTHAPEVLNILKSFHDLLPYGAMKLGLSLVNPTLAIKAVVQIVLGQPAGQASLFQRIFAFICNGGIKAQTKLVEAARKKVNNESICNSVEKHVYASFTQRDTTRADAERNREDILVSIIRKHGSDYEVKQVKGWQAEFARWEAQGAPEDSLREDDPVNRFINLKDLLASYCRKRDREQVLNIVMEPNTPRLLHASISVFYDTIYKVANASNLSARLGDLQAFLDDLIATALSDKKTPADFINLTARHDQSLYYLVHELASNGGTLLDPLIDWCKSGLAFIDKGIPSAPRDKSDRSSRSRSRRHNSSSSARKPPPPPSSAPSRRAGIDFDELLAAQPDDKTRRAVLDDARSLARWSRYKKAYADICLRVDMLQAQARAQGDGGGGGGGGRGHDFVDDLDKADLYEDLVAQDRDVAGRLVERRDDGGVEGGLEWAWFAAPDVAAIASGERRKFERQQRDKAADELRREKEKAAAAAGGRGLFRTKSRSQGGAVAVVDDDELKDEQHVKVKRKQVPEPTVGAARKLLDKYRDLLRPALDAAREANVK